MDQPLIDIVYLDGMAGKVTNDVLDVLIATGRIQRFRRKDGWVDLTDHDTALRDYRRDADFEGQERRSPWPEERS